MCEVKYDNSKIFEMIVSILEGINYSKFEILGYSHLELYLKIHWYDAYRVDRLMWIDDGMDLKYTKGELINHDPIESAVSFKKKYDEIKK